MTACTRTRIYYNMSKHLQAIHKPLVVLFNYTIFYAIRLESVYKMFRKNTLNKPAAGGTIGTENRGTDNPINRRKEKSK